MNFSSFRASMADIGKALNMASIIAGILMLIGESHRHRHRRRCRRCHHL